MTPVALVLWGLAGGLMVETLELAAATRRLKRWPWQVAGEMGLSQFLFCALTRPSIGAPLALALGTSGQISGPAGALLVGISAPLIVQAALRRSAPIPPESVPAEVVAATAGPPGFKEPTADAEGDEAAVNIELGVHRGNLL